MHGMIDAFQQTLYEGMSCNKPHLGCEWRVISAPPKAPHPPPPWQTLWPEGLTSGLTSIQPTPLYHHKFHLPSNRH